MESIPRPDSGVFDRFRTIGSVGEAAGFGERLARCGFSAVRRFLEEFRDYLKQYTDDETPEAEALLDLARIALPEPGTVSPSWERIWDEYQSIIAYKSIVYSRIPVREREGEWQVLIDNPFTHQQIVVYPGLTFAEAAYLFAYFRSGLARNEHIRLQKIVTLVSDTGSG
ncbi:hypothetical protein PACILC2_53920 [Paenibacillus cisolokensis]|uniref:Uncharacterized protein n=1 Tax=Paenibacillus cisolokensis TaxID=1658519 RepID=A0ABQ4NF19_9BACL|nr:hypothetical protein [Paenibacillus cisolokensis]GIQ66824.1 hypothetical protein PACILC2_53920 [Paenibacillus cisolokensis]